MYELTINKIQQSNAANREENVLKCSVVIQTFIIYLPTPESMLIALTQMNGR